MCGICGILHIDPEKPVDPELLRRMNAVQAHRGPDARGVWHRKHVGLGHVRLAVIDLSPQAHQPMANEDQSLWLTFNGEIYNFRELRQELLCKGHQFRSQSDTEVILHLWEEEGVRCVERLRGMFAFALWDERRQVLFLARDRVGKKPLFYARLPDRFLFASEIKAILQDPDLRPEPDLEALHYYLTYQAVPSPYSAFRGIRKLPPAHWLLVHQGELRLQRYWQLSYREKWPVPAAKTEEALTEELLERLQEAVRLRLISEVPLGAFLSGGVDSSLVVALMCRLQPEPVKTFSISFPQADYDETPFVRLVVQRYHTEHHEFQVTPQAEAIFPHLVWHYNEPFADPSAIPTFYLSRLARQHVTVVLNGDGGDENFAGYPRYALNGTFDRPSLGDWLKLLLSWRLFLWQEFRRPGRSPRNVFPLRLFSYYWRLTQFHELHQEKLYGEALRAVKQAHPAFCLVWEKFRAARADSLLDRLLAVDLELYLPEVLMVKVDVASMAHALEARSPLLDHQFLEFAARLPTALKLKQGRQSKYLLKKAAAPYLPEDILRRPKMGFGVPLEHWFRQELKDLVWEVLLGSRARARGYFRPPYVEKLIRQHQRGERNWQYLLWNLLMLELWHQMFIDRSLSPPGPLTLQAEVSKLSP